MYFTTKPINELNLIFANKLRELRKEHNLKQDVVAKELKITQQAYSKLERGDLNFNSVMLKKICLFFDIPVASFLNTNNNFKTVNNERANIHNDDPTFIQELLKSKEETIVILRDLLNTQKKLLHTKEILISSLRKK